MGAHGRLQGDAPSALLFLAPLKLSVITMATEQCV